MFAGLVLAQPPGLAECLAAEPRVGMHLPATGLRPPELHLHAQPLKQTDYRSPGLRRQRAVITGYEERSARKITRYRRQQPGNRLISLKKSIVYCNDGLLHGSFPSLPSEPASWPGRAPRRRRSAPLPRSLSSNSLCSIFFSTFFARRRLISTSLWGSSRGAPVFESCRHPASWVRCLPQITRLRVPLCILGDTFPKAARPAAHLGPCRVFSS